jgi:protein-tyrosine-phosphatase
MSRPLKTLILCTGNSARSVIAEYLLRARGKGRFEVHSAGSRPTGRVNPFALRVLKERYGIDATDAYSKSWDEFRTTHFDLVITVCDNAKESCPLWPGAPIVAHWSSPDPAGVTGNDEVKQRAFIAVATQIDARIKLLCALPEEKLLADRVQAIGREHLLNDESAMPR